MPTLKSSNHPGICASAVLLASCYATLHLAIALSIPHFSPATHNDDWVYADPVKKLCQGEGFRLHPLTGALAIPQILAGWTVCNVSGGFSFALLRNTMALLGLVPVLLLWLLLLKLQFSPRLATLAALIFMTNPITVSLTWSFQSDLAFVAFALGAVLATLHAGQRDDAASFWCSFILLLLASLTRQSAMLLAVAVAIFWQGHHRYWRVLFSLCLVPVVMLVEHWVISQSSLVYLPFAKDQLSNALKDLGGARLFLSTYSGLRLVGFLGLLLLPLLLADHGVKKRRQLVLLAAWASLFLGIFAMEFMLGHSSLPGNYLYLGERWGVGPLTLALLNTAPASGEAGSLSAVLDPILGLAVALGGTLLAFRLGLIAADLVRSIRQRMSSPEMLMFGVFAICLLTTLLTSAVMGRPFFDRYVLVLVPFAIPLCIHPQASRPKVLLTTVPAVVVGLLISYCGVVDYWRWNESRWEATAWLEARGVAPERIDGGYEYNALHGTLEVPEGMPSPTSEARAAEIDRILSEGTLYTIRCRPVTHELEIARFPYRSPLYRKVQYIYVTEGRRWPSTPGPGVRTARIE